MLSGPRPIPFITEDPRCPSHFIIDPAAAALLESIKGPICPVVVAGPYRSGKSTLLNLLLPPSASSSASSTAAASRRPGFAVGSSNQPCTKGIWLWGEPIKAEGKTILLLDTQALCSTDRATTLHVNWLSLSILLASLFLFNTSGSINEGASDELKLVVQMTERIRAKDARVADSNCGSSGVGGLMEDELHALTDYFPDILWVLRDFSRELKDSRGRPISSKQYLKRIMQPVAGARAVEKNRLHHVLTTVFPSRDCVFLSHPVIADLHSQHMQSPDVRELRGEFRAEVSLLRQRVAEQVQPKAVEGVTVTGSTYLSLAEAYVRAINSDTTLIIHSAWTAVVELQAKKAMEEAHALFHSDVKELSASLHSSAELAKALDAAAVKAQQLLTDNVVGDAEFVGQLRKQLAEWIRDVSGRVRELDGTKSHEHNQRVWSDVWKRSKGDSVVEEADDERAWVELEARVRAEYNKHARGEGRELTLTEALAGGRERMMARVGQRRAEEKRQLTELQKNIVGKDMQLVELDKQVANLALEVQIEKRSNSEERKRADEAEARLADEKRRSEQQLTELREQLKQTLEAALKAHESEVGRMNIELACERRARSDEVSRAREAEKKVDDERCKCDRQVKEAREQLKESQQEGESRTEELLSSLRRLAALEAELRTSESEVRRVRDEAQRAESKRQEENVNTRIFTPSIPPPQSSSFLPPPPRPAKTAGRRSLAPARRSDDKLNDSTELVDPNVMTVQELKSWLTELNVDLPEMSISKDKYVNMVYAVLPELNEVFPKKGAR